MSSNRTEKISANNVSLNIHVYPSPLRNESRILKITESLSRSGHFSEIEVLGKFELGLEERVTVSPGVSFVRLDPGFEFLPSALARPLRVLAWYLKAFLYLLRRRPKCINVHSLPVLPLGVFAKWAVGGKLIYDTHELETEVSRSRGFFRIVYKITESALIGFCDEVCVVNQSIAEWYRNRYGLPRVWVVRNIPKLHVSAEPSRGALRGALKIGEGDRLFLYQGLLSHGRGIQQMLKAFSGAAEGNQLVFMGYGSLESLITQYAASCPQIHLHPAVEPKDLHLYTADADVGLSLIENICLSYYLSLPNKVFEYVSVGVPVVVSDFPEMRSFVNEQRCGWTIHPTESALKELILNMSKEDIEERRLATRLIGHSFSWENEELQLRELYLNLFGQPTGFPRTLA